MVAATADVLPGQVVQTTLTAVGHQGLDSNGDPRLRFPVSLGARFGVGGGIEVNAAVYAVAIEGTASVPVGGSLAGKWRFYRGELGVARASVALAARAAAELDPRTDSFTNFPGLGLLVPASVSLGAVHFSLAPELVLSPVEPLHQAGATQDAEWEACAYIRGTLLLDFGAVVGSASAALRTAAFASGLAAAADLPLKAGADVHVLVPETPLYLGAAGLLELTDATNYFLEGGVSVGLLF